jgi:hypothetical protein
MYLHILSVNVLQEDLTAEHDRGALECLGEIT